MQVNIFWFRRDLRLNDNAGLYHALKSGLPVLPIFIFDSNILERLDNKSDRRVEFIYDALNEMQQELISLNVSLEVYHGTPLDVFKKLLAKYSVDKVFTNDDYELYARQRDSQVKTLLETSGATLISYKDQVIFEKNEVIKDDGTPYTIFTPYSKKWKASLTDFHVKSYLTKKYFDAFYNQKPQKIPSLTSMGFNKVGESFPTKELNKELIKKYGAQRDYPAIHGTSKLGLHLRFGTISIRMLVNKAQDLNETFLKRIDMA